MVARKREKNVRSTLEDLHRVDKDSSVEFTLLLERGQLENLRTRGGRWSEKANELV